MDGRLWVFLGASGGVTLCLLRRILAPWGNLFFCFCSVGAWIAIIRMTRPLEYGEVGEDSADHQARDGDLGHLECDGAGVAHCTRPDLA